MAPPLVCKPRPSESKLPCELPGSYCKPAEAHPRHSSKSSHASDSPTVCASSADPPHIWDLKKVSSNKLNESQSSLTSHSSSLGNSNKTQSTSLSNENSKRKSIDRRSNKNIRPENVPEGYAPKNIVVNSNGDTFETKLTF
uniref:Uncharacterized protein n=1 Tax=Photinus pyralis TaxID=7054 RepID=A0A1Y1M0I5_PHOPY